MEKYRSFADPSTGINPFLPSWVNKKSRFYDKIFKLLLLPLVICRLVFIGLTIIFMIFLNGLLKLLIFPSLKDFFYQIIQAIYCRLLLFYMGFFYLDEQYAYYNRLKIKCTEQKIPFTYDDYGHIYLCNFTSFVDVLYLSCRLNPLFIVINKNGTMSPVCFFDILKLSLQFSIYNKNGIFKNIEEVNKYAKTKKIHNVVIFPEAMKSNGSCILLWKNKIFMNSESLKNKCNIITFIYEINSLNKKMNHLYTSPHTTFHPFVHLTLLCFNIYNTIKIIWLSEKDIYNSLKEIEFQNHNDFVNHLRNLMGKMRSNGGNTLVDVEADSLEKFVNYWNMTRKSKYL